MGAKANENHRTKAELLEEIEQLRTRLDEAEQTLDAIRSGDVDALVVSGPHGDQVFSLTGAERTYRLIVETMNEAALTVAFDGTILFCNQRFFDLVKTPMASAVGQKLTAFVAPDQQQTLRMLLADAQSHPVQEHLILQTADGAVVPIQLSASLLAADTETSICLVASDLTALETQAGSISVLRKQQQDLEESRAELQAANTLLHDSRLAALNMMEDADIARKRAEEISADMLCEVLERKQAEEALRIQARTLKALNSGNHALLHATDELSLLQAICNTVVEDCGHAMVWIGYADEDEEMSVRPVAQAGFEEGYLETLKISWADTERGRGPTGVAIRTGKPCGCSDIFTDPDFEPWRGEALKHGYAASLVLPLMGDGKAFGALNIYSPKPHAFSEEETKLLMQLADELAYGIRAVRLRVAHDQAEEMLGAYYRRQDLLADTASRLLAADSPQEIVDSLCQKVMDFLDCQAFFNFLAEEGSDRLHLNACAGIPEEEKQKIQWLDYGVAVCGCAARDACRIVAEDIPNTPDPRTELVKSYGIRAYACHPLMAQGRVLGTLSFGTRTRTCFSYDDLSLMKAVADQVAIAMERKRVEEDLWRAKEEAEASTRAKSQFLANMSHELRTPMTGVLGMLDLALSTSLNERQRECISTAHNSARSLLRIINDILDLTKIEAGRLSIEEKPFNLRECVSCAIETLGTVAMRKNLELLHSIAPDLPHNLIGDQLRLRQVLINLIGNGVKFTEAGKVELRVTAGEAAPDGRREVTFSVSDTGIGIPADKKYLLFNPFSQVDDSNTRSYGGSGLGLVISKEIVELMDGKIGFESEEGKGSTFFFSIPLGEAVLERDTMGGTQKPDVVEPVAERSVAGKKPRLLLAEDDPVIRKILEMMLVRANFDLDFAENGEKAVEKWEQGEYDLILMDVQMPLMDGFAATRLIREQEQARGGHTIIVAMTAHALKQDQERCFAAGMDAYISKPIDLKKSIELITDLLNIKSTSGAPF